MPSINNFFGTKRTVGKIFYSENLSKNLRLIISQQYLDTPNPTLVFEAGICSEMHNSASGVQYYYDAYEWCCSNQDYINLLRSQINNNSMLVIPSFKEKFEDEEIKTKNGFIAKKYREEYRIENGFEIWRETWRIEMSAADLLSLLKNK